MNCVLYAILYTIMRGVIRYHSVTTGPLHIVVKVENKIQDMCQHPTLFAMLTCI